MSSIICRVENGIAFLVLDSADSRVNVLSRGLVRELRSVLGELAGIPGLKGLVLASGKPGLFCAGADLHEFHTGPTPGGTSPREYVLETLAMMQAIEQMPVPTVCCLDGAALGGGLELALAFDMRIVGSHSKIRLAMPEVSLALMPGFGGTQRLPRVAGFEQAFRMIILGEEVAGDQACSAGLALARVPSEQLVPSAITWLQRSEQASQQRQRKLHPLPDPDFTPWQSRLPMTDAARDAFEVMRVGAPLLLGEAIPHETRAFLQRIETPEARERIAQFFAGRTRPSS